MTLKQFCKLLSAIPGKWIGRRKIRVWIDDKLYCPITAVYYQKTGLRVSTFEWRYAAGILNLKPELAKSIAMVSDGFLTAPKPVNIHADLLKAMEGH